MIIIMKHLTSYADDAPFLIIALFKKNSSRNIFDSPKIHKQLELNSGKIFQIFNEKFETFAIFGLNVL
jgi:hypothetical protein